LNEDSIWKKLMEHNNLHHGEKGREFMFEIYYTLKNVLNIKVPKELVEWVK